MLARKELNKKLCVPGLCVLARSTLEFKKCFKHKFQENNNRGHRQIRPIIFWSSYFLVFLSVSLSLCLHNAGKMVNSFPSRMQNSTIQIYLKQLCHKTGLSFNNQKSVYQWNQTAQIRATRCHVFLHASRFSYNHLTMILSHVFKETVAWNGFLVY